MRLAHVRMLAVALAVAAGATLLGQTGATIGGALPPLFPADNWWNQDVSQAPVAAESAALINFINNGGNRQLHPDFGGYAGGMTSYGIPYIVVPGTQPKRTVQFYYSDESDGVGVPFYPIPDEAITQPYWIEGGPPGNQAPGGDRHMLIVDRDNKKLYELFDLGWDGTKWTAGSGAYFDLQTNGRRPAGWTSADAAGLAILPGLVKYDEVYSTASEITHAFRVTVRATNSFYVWPASHVAGSNVSAPPNGTRLRMKASKDISGFPAPMQKIFRAMKKYGLIVADNGSDMYITGAFDPRWDNGVLNPAFHALHASDFEVVQLGWQGGGSTPPPPPPPCTPGAPTGLWSSVSGSNVQLGWTPPSGTLLGHQLDVGSGPGLTNIGSWQIPAPQASFAAVAPAGRYYVRVRAGSSCGIGPASNEVVVVVGTSCAAPAAPGTLQYAVNARTVSLAWGAAAGAQSYQLEVGFAPGASNALVTNVGASLNVGGPVPPATYYARVRARNACGMMGPASNEVVVTVR